MTSMVKDDLAPLPEHQKPGSAVVRRSDIITVHERDLQDMP